MQEICMRCDPSCNVMFLESCYIFIFLVQISETNLILLADIYVCVCMCVHTIVAEHFVFEPAPGPTDAHTDPCPT